MSALWATVSPIWEFIKWPLFYLGPFVLLIFFVYIIYKRWYAYKRLKNIFFGDFVLLEVVLPRNIFKPPQAMETAMSVFNQRSDGNWIEHLLKGKHRPWFSLEMVSIAGTVHFYIRAYRIFKPLIESAIYAQYPEVEIRESDDYVRLVPYGIGINDEHELWGMELELTKDDPYPIKTYMDYGLNDQKTEEENKVDPISATIETLGSLGRGEFCFIQILVQSTKDRYLQAYKWWPKWLDKLGVKSPMNPWSGKGWKDEGKALIKKMTGKKDKEGKPIPLEPGEDELVKAIQKSLTKAGFDTGIRAIYASKKESWSDAHKVAIINAFSQYNTPHLNGFKPGITTGADTTILNTLRKKNTEKLEKKMKAEMWESYRHRAYFYPPYQAKKPFVLNSEELATIFHFPGGVTTTGGLPRIESKKAEAPTNLPI